MHISIEGLGKQYNVGVHALKHLDLDISSGLFGLLGPNGAGKTTLMRILVTLLEPTRGRVTIDGMDLERDRGAIRAMLGYLPQYFNTFSKLSTWEFLDYAARLAGIRRRGPRKQAVDHMLETVGLFEARDRQANRLSGGMKRRLGIAQALIGNPQVIIVDEPTIGLDPEERLRFRNLMADLSHGGRIIILSTHIVGDISSSCNSMAILNKGELVYNASPAKFIENARGHVWLMHVSDSELHKLKEQHPVVSTIPSRDGWDVQVVCETLDGHTGTPIEPNLEHAYVHFLESRLGESWYADVSGVE